MREDRWVEQIKCYLLQRGVHISQFQHCFPLSSVKCFNLDAHYLLQTIHVFQYSFVLFSFSSFAQCIIYVTLFFSTKQLNCRHQVHTLLLTGFALFIALFKLFFFQEQTTSKSRIVCDFTHNKFQEIKKNFISNFRINRSTLR